VSAISVKRYVFGITGASGGPYAVVALDALAENGCEVMLVVTDPGRRVLEHETGLDVAGLMKRYTEVAGRLGKRGGIRVFENDDLFAPIASGSFRTDGMIIMPCSMGTAAAVAHGVSDNLLRRAADVTLKEGRRLVVVPREMPMSAIHLRNLLVLSEAGVRVVPAMPFFYDKPESVGDLLRQVAGRALSALGEETDLVVPWSTPTDDDVQSREQ
jgi:flavin prenyltransferase